MAKMPSKVLLVAIGLVGLVVLLAVGRNGLVEAGPAPEIISSVVGSVEQLKPKEAQDTQQVETKSSSTANNLAKDSDLRHVQATLIGKSAVLSPAKPLIRLPTGNVAASANEKVRRGLSNFMNNLNPAPFFVPVHQQLQGAGKLKTPSQTSNQAEPATIVSDGPTADALIKGPNRLVQARPLGGPLRWGRRK